MAAKLVLDMEIVQEQFFQDAVLIGIASALPQYRFCWFINSFFDIELSRTPDYDICINTKNGDACDYAVYRFEKPNQDHVFSLYQLISNKQLLLPELKQMDYLMMIQGIASEQVAAEYIRLLRQMNEVQMAQIIQHHHLKNIDSLLF